MANKKLTPAQEQYVRSNPGRKSLRALAKELGVSHGTIAAAQSSGAVELLYPPPPSPAPPPFIPYHLRPVCGKDPGSDVDDADFELYKGILLSHGGQRCWENPGIKDEQVLRRITRLMAHLYLEEDQSSVRTPSPPPRDLAFERLRQAAEEALAARNSPPPPPTTPPEPDLDDEMFK